MKKKFFKVFLSLILGLSIFPQMVLADGIILPPPDYPVYQAEQKAVLFYDSQNKIEDLVISVIYNGSAKDFGWVVPVPNKPEVNKVDDEIFNDLATMTKPKKNLLEKLKYGSSISRYSSSTLSVIGGVMESTKDEEVQVIETKRVGILDIAVLSAQKPKALTDWLDENGYQLPGVETKPIEIYRGLEKSSSKTSGVTEDLEKEIYPYYPQPEPSLNEALIILQDYIDDDWYFVAAKINPTFIDEKGAIQRLSQGHINPLRFTFQTNDMVYPMKLTSLAKKSINVLLYVFSDQKLEVKNLTYDEQKNPNSYTDVYYPYPSTSGSFRIQYAENIKGSEIKELTTEINKPAWYSPNGSMYLTKLYASYLSYTKMDQDYTFVASADNEELNTGKMKKTDWLVLPFYLVVYGPARLFEWVLGSNFYFGSTLWRYAPILLGFLLLIGIIWSAIFYFLLTKSRNRFVRAFWYFCQVPGVWVLSSVFSLGIAIPYWFLMDFLNIREDAAGVNTFLTYGFGTTFFALIFYKLQDRIGKGKKKKESGSKK